MLDTSITLGNLVAGLGVIATWYFNVKRFRKEDKSKREQQHEENQKRLVNIERHLGGPNAPPLSERVGKIEVRVDNLEDRIRGRSA